MVFFSQKGLTENWQLPMLDELFEQTLFTRVEGCCSRTFLENNLKIVGHCIKDFKNVVVFEDMNLILQSVKNGDGVGYISSDIIKTCTNPTEISTFEIEGFLSQRKRALIFNNDPSLDPMFEEFRVLVFQAMNQFPLKSLG
jgi:DNA-binding transcriptional LysR family regulator